MRRFYRLTGAATLALAVTWTIAAPGSGGLTRGQAGVGRSATTPVSHGAVEQIPGRLQLKGGDISIARQTLDESTQMLAAIAEASERHILIQFEQAVTPAQRAALEAAGVKLQAYLSDHAYFAAVSHADLDPIAATDAAPVFAVEPIDAAWKQHPDLLAGEIYEWMVVGLPKDMIERGFDPAQLDNPRVGVYMLFHDDVSLDGEGVAILRSHGAHVRSLLRTVNGAVIELPYSQIASLAGEDAVLWIEPPLPKFTELNDNNRQRVGANIVQGAPYNLTGAGVSVLVYDGGFAAASHPDFGGRLFVRDSSGLSTHASHVSGTVGGSGQQSGGTFKGMAPGVTIQSYGFEQEGGLQQGFLYTDPGDIEADYGQAINTFSADIANNSIGTNTASNGFPCDWEGNYGITDTVIDAIARGSLSGEPFRIVWAAGNERSSGRCGSTYNTSAPPANAKNHITIGAMNSNDDSVTSFTSWGPSDDGRMRPDMSAPGCQSGGDNGVTSCDSGSNYTVFCGTSMASPTVCGLGALLIQDYRQQFPGEPDMRGSTMKAIFANTALDIDAVGPDFKTGMGSVRIQPAVDLLRAGNFFEGEVDQGGTVGLVVIVGPGDTQLRVTLAWDDPPGTPVVNPTLVNDLDLSVFDPSNTQRFPWTLNPASPATPAVQNAPNRRDNMEQLTINSPAPGAYRIEITGFNVPQGPQTFSVAASPLLVACSDVGIVSLDRSKYPCGGDATVQVVDCGLNTSDLVIDTVVVNVASTSEGAGESLVLTETAAESAAFRGTIALSQTDAPGVLLIAPDDVVTATYIDADDGQGNFNVSVTDTADVDCTAPVISNVAAINVEARSADITFNTDEAAQSRVYYGTSCGSLISQVDGTGLNTSHTIALSGLTDEVTYYYAVEAVDAAGNLSYDDNGGSCYSFTTPDVPNFFTEEFTGDRDLDGYTMTFSPNGSPDFYSGCIEQAEDLPTNPAGGTTVSLTDDSFATANLTGGQQVLLYGNAYGTLYIGSNGYVTLDSGDTDYTETLADHFARPRVAALFDDLNPSTGGTVSWKQTADRVAVTWQNVPEYGTSNSNTFQIEMHFNGDITITHLTVAVSDCITGLSEGVGLDPDFFESDLSAMGNCGPRPPIANNGSANIPANDPAMITLSAVDDGLPGPLSYVIASLPSHGSLSDPGNGAPINGVPYTLVGGGNAVEYNPDDWDFSPDSFQFKANDGGSPPEGGDSNVATVQITLIAPPAELARSFPLDTNPGWSTEGQWAFGVPAGLGSRDHDPTSGKTGSNVYGYNLNGDYTNNMPRYNLTTTAIDCSDLLSVELRFWRWLGVETMPFDHATVEASSDGSNWTVLWENTDTVSDTAWTQMTFDITSIASEEPTVYLRWSMGPTDNSNRYPGWNIDDVELWGVIRTPNPIGDVDGDGDVDLADLSELLESFGLCVGDAGYNPDADLDDSGCVNLGDLSTLLENFGL